MHRLTVFVVLTVLALTAAACATEAPPTATPTSSIAVEPTDTATLAPADTPSPTASAAPQPTPTPTARALTGPRATAEALTKKVTVVPATPSGETSGRSIAPDDYPAILEQAWQIVADNYVRDSFNGVDWQAVGDAYRSRVATVTDQAAFWDLMTAFIRELNDDHSRFVPPDRFAAEFDLPNDAVSRPWAGLQIWPAREDEQLLIWYVCQVGPAADAGLQRGDVILAVEGQPVVKTAEGFDAALRQQAMFGDGQTVTLTVQHGPDRAPKDVKLRLGGAFGCDGWQAGLLSESPRVGYVRVPDFSGDADVNLLDAIERLEQESPLEGLVVDVRHNPGGNADRAIAIFTSGVFGQVGPLRADATQTTYRIRGPVRWNETTPVAVLTDGASHSAAEYFATAMQQSGRAVLVGMPTAGNTEGITGFNLADGSLIRLAVSTLQLPDGSTLEGTGVIPDIQAPLGDWGLRQSPDLQLLAAHDALVNR
ncbi:MAG: S41 family peptidase [Chloroflexota bacterium]